MVTPEVQQKWYGHSRSPAEVVWSLQKSSRSGMVTPEVQQKFILDGLKLLYCEY